MSLVTSCPHCSVIFVVRPEQLAAQQGKVRCGSCRQVFNALDSLQEPVLDTEASQAVTEDSNTLISDTSEAAVAEETPASVEVEYAEAEDATPYTDPAASEYAQPDDSGLASDSLESNSIEPNSLESNSFEYSAPEYNPSEYHEPALDAPIHVENSDSGEVTDEQDMREEAVLVSDQHFAEELGNTSDHNADNSDPPGELSDVGNADEPDAGNKTFAAEPIPKLNEVISDLLVPIDLSPPPEEPPSAFSDIAIEDKLKPSRKRRISTLSIIVISLILLMLAAVQTVYFMRTAISTEWPVLRPHLVATCKIVGCVLELPRNADLLTVDDSDLQEDNEHPGVIRLRSTLINNARYTQQYPLLELTLTDANQAPVLRRTFKPAEYLPAGSDIKAGLSANDEVHINLAIATKEPSVSSYRVYITY